MVGLKKIYNMFELADEMSNYSIDDVESAIEILETPIEKQLRHEYIRMAFQEKKYLKLDAMDNKYKRRTEADYSKLSLGESLPYKWEILNSGESLPYKWEILNAEEVVNPLPFVL